MQTAHSMFFRSPLLGDSPKRGIRKESPHKSERSTSPESSNAPFGINLPLHSYDLGEEVLLVLLLG